MCLHFKMNYLAEWRKTFSKKNLELKGAERMCSAEQQRVGYEIQFLPLEGGPECHKDHLPASEKTHSETIQDKQSEF